MACLDWMYFCGFTSRLSIVAANVILARVLLFAGLLFQLQVDFGYLLKKNGSSSVAGFKRLKLLGIWLQTSGRLYQAWHVSQFGCFWLKWVSSRSSSATLPVNTCPSSTARLSHSAALILECADSTAFWQLVLVLSLCLLFQMTLGLFAALLTSPLWGQSLIAEYLISYFDVLPQNLLFGCPEVLHLLVPNICGKKQCQISYFLPSS